MATANLDAYLDRLLLLGMLIICADADCPPLPMPVNGEMPLPCGTALGDRCHFGCQRGFILLGSCHRECAADGQWLGIEAVCISLDRKCSQLSPPVNGALITQCLNSIGSSCSFECNDGYELRGAQTVNCINPGDWSAPVPSCVQRIVKCPNVRAPSRGRASEKCRSAVSGDVCEFECNEGYKLSPDTRSIKCRDDGTWSDDAPRCDLQKCEAAPNIPNGSKSGQCSPGRVGKECVYACNGGYAISGSPAITCESNEEWHGELPTCVQVGSVCSVVCDEGYLSVNTRSFECMENGQWSPRAAAVCRPVTCPSLSAPSSGTATGSCAPGLAGKECTFTCNTGYKMSGSPSASCQSSGGWTSTPPTCRAITCVSLQSPVDGFVTGRCVGAIVGNECTFSCSDGYVMSGDARLSCQGEGEWSANPPVCRRLRCPSVSAPQPKGMLLGTCQPGIAGEMCAFACQANMRLEGLTNIACRTNGEWSGPVPRCVLIARQVKPDCPSIFAPPGGSVQGTCSPGRVGMTCTLNCPTGYKNVGARIVRCFSTGAWAPARPDCIRVASRPVCRGNCCAQRRRARRAIAANETRRSNGHNRDH